MNEFLKLKELLSKALELEFFLLNKKSFKFIKFELGLDCKDVIKWEKYIVFLSEECRLVELKLKLINRNKICIECNNKNKYCICICETCYRKIFNECDCLPF